MINRESNVFYSQRQVTANTHITTTVAAAAAAAGTVMVLLLLLLLLLLIRICARACRVHKYARTSDEPKANTHTHTTFLPDLSATHMS